MLGSGARAVVDQQSSGVARFDRTLDTAWRRTSYSALTASVHEAPRVSSEPESPGTTDEPEEPPPVDTAAGGPPSRSGAAGN